MNFRLKLLKFLLETSDEAVRALSKKSSMKIDVLQTTVYQSLFFFPILSMIIDIYYPKHGLTPLQTISYYTDLFEPYSETARKYQRFKLKPKIDFPALKDVTEIMLYNSTLEDCLKVYLETLSENVDFCMLKFIQPIVYSPPQLFFTNVKLPGIPFLEAQVIYSLKQHTFLFHLLEKMKTPWDFSRNIY